MTVHHLKTASVYWAEIKSGHKTAELRLNDRGYKIGDKLLLYRGVHPGYMDNRCIQAFVGGMLSHDEMPRGLQPGYVILYLCCVVEVDKNR